MLQILVNKNTAEVKVKFLARKQRSSSNSPSKLLTVPIYVPRKLCQLESAISQQPS